MIDYVGQEGGQPRARLIRRGEPPVHVQKTGLAQERDPAGGRSPGELGHDRGLPDPALADEQGVRVLSPVEGPGQAVEHRVVDRLPVKRELGGRTGLLGPPGQVLGRGDLGRQQPRAVRFPVGRPVVRLRLTRASGVHHLEDPLAEDPGGFVHVERDDRLPLRRVKPHQGEVE
jgi:hypothetical protein